MIKTLQIIILILSLLDLTATYYYVSTFHSKFPSLDYTQLEANPILRYSWRTFGLNLGMIIGGVIVLNILILLIFNMKESWLFFFLGLFTMMLIYHILNFAQLANLKPSP